MKIGLLWHSSYPWDIRIEKFLQAMARGNNEVTLITGGKSGQPVRERSGRVTQYRIVVNRRLAGRLLAAIIAIPLFFNPWWFASVLKIVRREGLQALVVRDLPLAMLAVAVGKLARVPVILDMAENYPAALLAYRKKIYAPFLVGNAFIPRLYERLSLACMDAVIVVAEEQQKRLVKLGVPGEKIFIVRNTPDDRFLQAMAEQELSDPDCAGSYILYTGFLDAHRGLRTLILAFNEIRREFPALKLMLVGSGSARRSLEDLARYLRLGERVIFKGWIDMRVIPAYIRNSSVCVIPHLKSEHTDTTMPNKIFDYMFFDKPIIVSDAVPLMRLVRELGSGYVFRSGDYVDCAAALAKGLRTRSAGRALKGRDLVRRKYNWEIDAATLRKLIETLA